MIKTMTKNWWLLVVCGVLEAILAFINFGHSANGFHSMRDVIFAGRVMLAAGACMIVVGAWGARKGGSWFLALNGFALIALGLLFNGVAGFRISLRTIALLMIVMAVSLGLVQLAAAKTMRHLHRLADGRLLALAGVVSVAFAVPFVALGFHWIRIEPGSFPELLWFGSFFSFSAICMLGMALRLHSLRDFLSSLNGTQGALP